MTILNTYSVINTSILISMILLYNFINIIFSLGILYLLFYIELYTWISNYVYTDINSISNFNSNIFSYINSFSMNLCNYVYILFYFILVFITAFLFFIIKCFFSIIYDNLFYNFDNFLSITNIDTNNLYPISIYMLNNKHIWNISKSIFYYLNYLNINCLCVFNIINIYFNIFKLTLNHRNIIIKTIFWFYTSYTKYCIHNLSTAILIYKNIYIDIFFVFSFSTIIFVSSFFSIFVKDYLFISTYADFTNNIFFYDIVNYIIYNYTKNNNNIIHATYLQN